MGVQRELEITVLSATNLKRRFAGTRGLSYAVVWIDSHSKASTHVAERAPGDYSSWNCVIRMLCREALLGSVAKAKLLIEVLNSGFDLGFVHKRKAAGTADMLLSELQANLVWGGCPGESSSSWSEPKRMTLDLRRLRTGSYQREKVVGSVDIEVRLGRATANPTAKELLAGGGGGSVIYYEGLPIHLERDEFLYEDRHAFQEKQPAPMIQPAQTQTQAVATPVYYQHAYVEKPKAVWRGINDSQGNGRMGILAMGVFI